MTQICVELPGRAPFLAKLDEVLSADEVELVAIAYALPKTAHQGQLRDDGSPYFNHPKSVAYILFNELRIFDCETIVAALLHDTSEDIRLRREAWQGLNLRWPGSAALDVGFVAEVVAILSE